MMKKNKELEINYQAYTMLIIRQKLPLFILGLAISGLLGYVIFKSNIIRMSRSTRTVKNAKQKVTVKKYTVQEGEDLWQIAEINYGSGFNAYDIAKANNLKEPYILQKDQVLVIPDVAKRSPTQGELTPVAASSEQVTLTDYSYVVQEGDYLFDIAQRAYGDGNLMFKIIEANGIVPPYDIEVGRQLTIPR